MDTDRIIFEFIKDTDKVHTELPVRVYFLNNLRNICRHYGIFFEVLYRLDFYTVYVRLSKICPN